MILRIPRKKTLLLLTVIVIALSGIARGQTEQSGLIATDNGVLVVWNDPGNYYTVEIKGKQIRPASQPLLFSADDRFLQIQTAEKKAFLKDRKKLDEKAILQEHLNWESAYIADVFRSRFGAEANITIDSRWHNLPNGMLALEWSYDMPKAIANPSARKQFYIEVVKRDHIFLVNSALADGDNETGVRQFLLDTINTMRSSDKPLSLKKASEMVRKGS